MMGETPKLFLADALEARDGLQLYRGARARSTRRYPTNPNARYVA